VRHPTLRQRALSLIAILAIPAWFLCFVGLVPLYATQQLLGSHIQLGPQSVGVFGAIWLASNGIALGVAIRLARMETEMVPSFQRPPLRLARAQLAFLHAHFAIQALDAYFQTRVESSLSRATAHLNQLLGRKGLPSLRLQGDQYIVSRGAVRKKEKTEYVIDVNPRELSRYQVLGTGWVWRIEEFSSALQLAKRRDWFEVTPETLNRLEALTQLPEKVLPRLYGAQDLPQVREVLGQFESFLYWTAQGDTPDASEAVESTRKQELADAADRLAAALDALPSLPADTTAVATARSLTERLRGWLSLDRQVVRFVGWAFVCLALAVIAALTIQLFLHVDDNTLAMLIIPTAFTAAAALTVLAPGKSRG